MNEGQELPGKAALKAQAFERLLCDPRNRCSGCGSEWSGRKVMSPASGAGGTLRILGAKEAGGRPGMRQHQANSAQVSAL